MLQKFKPKDIYIVDETGLFYSAAQNGSLVYKHEALSDSKKAVDSKTCVGLFALRIRLHKLLVIGKNVESRFFNELGSDSLPAQHHANKNAWMSSLVFEKWLTDWDKELRLMSRKILLILNNFDPHPNVDCLANI